MQKIVDFEWCHKCEHYNVVDWDDPCNDCLNNPANEDSRRPLYFKPKDEPKKDKKAKQ